MSNSCNFLITDGITSDTCFNKCQGQLGSECLNYCKTKCELVGNQAQMDLLRSKYNTLTDQIKMYQASEGKIYNHSNISDKAKESSINLRGLEKIKDLDTKRNIIWKYLLSTHDVNSMLISSAESAIEKSKSITETQDNLREQLKRDAKKINNENTTVKKIVEANKYQYEKTLHEYTVFKNILIVLSISFIFPLLIIPKFTWNTKNGLLFLWSLVIFSLAIYLFIELVYKRNNKDQRIYHDKNFSKPTGSVILQSKTSKSQEDRKEMGNIDFDPSTIDIGNINRYISKKDPKGKCEIDTETDKF